MQLIAAYLLELSYDIMSMGSWRSEVVFETTWWGELGGGVEEFGRLLVQAS